MTDDRPRGFEADDELLELMESYCNGTISAEGLERLELRLASDTSAMGPFVVYLELHSRLRQCSSRTSKALSIPESLAELDRKLVFSPPQEEPNEGASPFSAFSHLTDFRVLGAAGLVTAAVSILLVFTFAGWLFGPKQHEYRALQGRSAPLAGSGDSQSNPPGALQVTPVARLTRVWKPEWREPKQGLTDWSNLTVGQVLELDSGKAEIFYTTGAQLILEAPFRFEVLGPNRGKVYYGNVVTRVSEEARGFSLLTSVGRVIDYGTEFGLRVEPAGVADLVVFEGEVGLEYAANANRSRAGSKSTESNELRLFAGQAARIGHGGLTERIVSIDSDHFPRAALEGMRASGRQVVIQSISDNIRESGAGPFYEIVHGGLNEDALAYVDRPYEWNGFASSGMPEFLIDADYIKTFNDDKRRSFEVTVKLAQAADVYLFWDNRVPPTEWLLKGFVKTVHVVGLDAGNVPSRKRKVGVGPGKSVDYCYSVWHRRVDGPTSITLGSLQQDVQKSSMYGIAAVAAPDTQ